MGKSGGGQSSVRYARYLQQSHGIYMFGQIPGGENNEQFSLDQLAVPGLFGFTSGTQLDTSLVPYSIWDLYKTAIDADSPYDTAAAYNPDDIISAANTTINKLDTLCKQSDGVIDFSTYVEAIEETVRTKLFKTSEIQTSVDEFRESLNPAFNRTLNDFTGQMVEGNAQNGMGFLVGISILEKDRQQQVAKFSSELFRKRVDTVSRMVEYVMNVRINQVSMNNELSKISIAAKQDQNLRDVELDVKNALWDLELTAYPNNGIAAIAGASSSTITDKEKSSFGSAVAGVASGALVGATLTQEGAALGSMVSPGIGTAIGAALGLGASLLS